LKIELKKYIVYYNTKRIKAKLKMSPVQYRTHFYQAA
ncbi:IS3 family transposase, partial [Bacillus thuringiensis]